MEKLHTKDVDNLFSAILSLETIDECYKFFEDALTVKEILVRILRVVERKGGLACLAKLFVGVFDRVGRAVDRLVVALFAHKHNVRDFAVTIEIHGGVVIYKVVSYHISLKISGFLCVSSDEGALVVAAHDRVRHLAVEEYYRYSRVFGEGNYATCGIIRAGGYDIYRDNLCALGYGCLYLLGLCGLTVVSVVILIFYSGVIKALVKRGTYGGYIGITVRIVENVNVGIVISRARRQRSDGQCQAQNYKYCFEDFFHDY